MFSDVWLFVSRLGATLGGAAMDLCVRAASLLRRHGAEGPAASSTDHDDGPGKSDVSGTHGSGGGRDE
jgi:hypothetical protein